MLQSRMVETFVDCIKMPRFFLVILKKERDEEEKKNILDTQQRNTIVYLFKMQIVARHS
jgi:hypothetical protein